MSDTINQVIGIMGACIILGAYAARAFSIIQGNRWLDLSLNFAGGAMLCWVAVSTRQLGLIFVEAAWSLISLGAMVRLWRAA